MLKVVKRFEVYICSLNKEVLYIGSGKVNRHKHCNSGTSHVYDLNKLHFSGNIFDIELKFFTSKEESLEEELALINQHVPKFNIVHTGKNTSKVDWLHKGDKIRKSFKHFNQFPEKSGIFKKMNNLLDLFLDVHNLPMIDHEGVLLRGRSFYKARGHYKIENLIKNYRCSTTGTTRIFIAFFSLLKLALEDTYEKSISFSWFDSGEDFSKDLLSLGELLTTDRLKVWLTET